MNKKYIIYLHRNKINGKCYIGQTCQSPHERWGQNGSGYKSQEYFYRAIKKYGWDNFDHIILEQDIDELEVNLKEVFWSGYYHSLAPEGYNLKVGGQFHYLESDKNKEIRSSAMKKNWQDKNYRKNISKKRKEEWNDPAVRKKCLQNLDRTGLGGKARRKAVQCVETGIIYESTREAERATGISHTNISQVCNGKRKTAGKFHWIFIEGGDE